MKHLLKIRTSGNRTSGDRTSGGPPVVNLNSFLTSVLKLLAETRYVIKRTTRKTLFSIKNSKNSKIHEFYLAS